MYNYTYMYITLKKFACYLSVTPNVSFIKLDDGQGSISSALVIATAGPQE